MKTAQERIVELLKRPVVREVGGVKRLVDRRMTAREIADALGLSIAAVRSALARLDPAPSKDAPPKLLDCAADHYSLRR